MHQRPDDDEDQELLDESIEESFPASDPPSHGGVTPAPDEDDEPLIDPHLPD